jgi:hypothetical protein
LIVLVKVILALYVKLPVGFVMLEVYDSYKGGWSTGKGKKPNAKDLGYVDVEDEVCFVVRYSVLSV